MGLFARIKTLFSRKKTPFRLGLALGSGGAKGMAHLGALKAFEEAGISFDVVAGSSIGAIVGALYVKGYDSAGIKGIVESLNRKEFSRNLRPFGELSFAEEFLGKYLEGNIEDLPKPFAAWATDGATNEGVLLEKGKITRSLTASAAIPPFFQSVELDGKKLYDGAFTNAVPADVCRGFGAQFVVGVDLGAFVRPEEERSRMSRILGTAIGAFVPVRYTADCKSRGYEAADVMICPDLLAFKATDIGKEGMEAMMEEGYRAAKQRMPEILSAIAEAKKRAKRGGKS